VQSAVATQSRRLVHPNVHAPARHAYGAQGVDVPSAAMTSSASPQTEPFAMHAPAPEHTALTEQATSFP